MNLRHRFTNIVDDCERTASPLHTYNFHRYTSLVPARRLSTIRLDMMPFIGIFRECLCRVPFLILEELVAQRIRCLENLNNSSQDGEIKVIHDEYTRVSYTTTVLDIDMSPNAGVSKCPELPFTASRFIRC
jgi:hypothetical protein